MAENTNIYKKNPSLIHRLYQPAMTPLINHVITHVTLTFGCESDEVI